METPLGLEKLMDDLRDETSLLASRICHDLISPLGAISNGLELLAMSGMGDTPEMKLIEESVESANSRIRFFRVALGAASGSQVLASSEIVKLIDGCYRNGRHKVRWNAAGDPPRTMAKLGLLAIMCMETALPGGGEIIVTSSHDDWTVQAFGPKIRFDAPLWGMVQGKPMDDLTSGMVHFALLRDGLAELGKSPLIGHSDSAVSLKF